MIHLAQFLTKGEVLWLFWRLMLLPSMETCWEGRGISEPQEKAHRRKLGKYLHKATGKEKVVQTKGILNEHRVSARNECAV